MKKHSARHCLRTSWFTLAHTAQASCALPVACTRRRLDICTSRQPVAACWCDCAQLPHCSSSSIRMVFWAGRREPMDPGGQRDRSVHRLRFPALISRVRSKSMLTRSSSVQAAKQWGTVDPLEECRRALHKEAFAAHHPLAGHPLFSIESLTKVDRKSVV